MLTRFDVLIEKKKHKQIVNISIVVIYFIFWSSRLVSYDPRSKNSTTLALLHETIIVYLKNSQNNSHYLF